MMISVKNAYANNLKNVSVEIPIGKISAITGVSGSGKSTLLKEILGAYGARNFTSISSKTVKDALSMGDNIFVEKIDNLPNTIFIDVKNYILNPTSTVSTATGIHELIRNLFIDHADTICDKCGNVVHRDYSLIDKLEVDIKVDNIFDEAIKFIEENGNVNKIVYFDKKGVLTNVKSKRSLATVEFMLNKINEEIIYDFNKKYNCSVYVISNASRVKYDFIKEIECPYCRSIGVRLIRSRLSYNTNYENGGGACRYCHGTGEIAKIKTECIFQDKNKGILDGASIYISNKGIKYSNITEKLISAVYKMINEDIRTPINKMSAKNIDSILYGIDEEITFVDRVGGKKTVIYEGLVRYLEKSYLTHKKGNQLGELFEKHECPKCQRTRFDISMNRFVYSDLTINTIMCMTLSELGVWCENIIKKTAGSDYKYIEKILKEINNFNMLSCGHLNLFRASNTLSGGEIQRIRIGALLNANIHGVCYLLDEPSSGLHYSDIEKLIRLLRIICSFGNTIVMVEHNKMMLSSCDYIIDLGLYGGKRGGDVLFSAAIDNIQEYNTATTQALLKDKLLNCKSKGYFCERNDFITFDNLNHNNLKNITVKLPKQSYIIVCGVSGSGKSTFINKEVYRSVSKEPLKYGFAEVDYLGQISITTNKRSTLSSFIKISDYIAKVYEKASGKKIKKNSFILGSTEGKCNCCKGSGVVYSEFGEIIGVCDDCGGIGFAEEVLNVKVNGLNIYDLYNTNLEDLVDIIDDVRLKNISMLGSRLGVGYLSLSRSLKTLSKGEIQRVSLINILACEKKNHLIILDEPSKGLHPADIGKLNDVLRELTLAGNTVLTVEHSPDMIKAADYIVEFGGTGKNGGYLLYQGVPSGIRNTPTAKMLKEFRITKQISVKNDSVIKIKTDKSLLKYSSHHIYYEQYNSKLLIEAAKQARENFLSVAIPNNHMFSKFNKTNLETNTPIMFIVDFNERLKYNITISDALGISSCLCDAAVIDTGKNVARYVFNNNSLTGKCFVCKGRGQVATVDQEYFIKDDELSPDCKKFLKNSTDYSKLSRLIKKDGIDISQSFNTMDGFERKVLLWGYEKQYNIEGDVKSWEGILPSFLKYHDYYPDGASKKVFNSRKEIKCPVCNGARLKEKYKEYKCCDLSFAEWMSLSVKIILDKIKSHNRTNFDDKISLIIMRLESLIYMGLGDVSLRDELISLDATSGAKIKLLSLFYNRIYDAGIVVKNISNSDSEDYIKKVLENLANTNTVWVV